MGPARPVVDLGPGISVPPAEPVVPAIGLRTAAVTDRAVGMPSAVEMPSVAVTERGPRRRMAVVRRPGGSVISAPSVISGEIVISATAAIRAATNELVASSAAEVGSAVEPSSADPADVRREIGGRPNVVSARQPAVAVDRPRGDRASGGGYDRRTGFVERTWPSTDRDADRPRRPRDDRDDRNRPATDRPRREDGPARRGDDRQPVERTQRHGDETGRGGEQGRGQRRDWSPPDRQRPRVPTPRAGAIVHRTSRGRSPPPARRDSASGSCDGNAERSVGIARTTALSAVTVQVAAARDVTGNPRQGLPLDPSIGGHPRRAIAANVRPREGRFPSVRLPSGQPPTDRRHRGRRSAVT